MTPPQYDDGDDHGDVAGGKLDPGAEGQWGQVAGGAGPSLECDQVSPRVEL